MKGFAILLSLTVLAYFNLKAQTKLKIYGGKNHDQYLGCLDCATDNLKSVWCIFGDYGSTHSDKSIWNEIGIYGSKTSDYSPYNEKAKYPPLILDESGKSYGYLTINKNNPKRSWDSFVNMISERRDEIVKDIPKYYSETFHDYK